MDRVDSNGNVSKMDGCASFQSTNVMTTLPMAEKNWGSLFLGERDLSS